MKKIYSSPEFQKLVQESDVKDYEKAVVREFFCGILEEVRATEKHTLIIKYTQRPALTDSEILKRLQDTRFCKYCFRFEIHDYECRNSGWHFE